MSKRVPWGVRRKVFGRDPEAYDRARLPYPSRVYEVLTTRCGLHPGATVFEVGAGTGIATRELLSRGANPLTVIEPDRRLARFLKRSLGPHEGRLSIRVTPFEDLSLSEGAFDLGVAASSFHWLPERRALRKVGRALRPGGWWAAWNNVHGDPYRASPFHRALQPLYRKLARGQGVSPGRGRTRASAAVDRERRIRALGSVHKFDRISREDIRWTVSLDTSGVKALWATFSDIVTLSPKDRKWFLTELEKVVDEQFGGRVRFPMLTPLYTARRH